MTNRKYYGYIPWQGLAQILNPESSTENLNFFPNVSNKLGMVTAGLDLVTQAGQRFAGQIEAGWANKVAVCG